MIGPQPAIAGIEHARHNILIFVATWAEALPLLGWHPRVTGIGRCPDIPDGCGAVISVGFAGACQPHLQAGDLLLGGDAPAELRRALGAMDGELRTLDHIASQAEKVDLGRQGVAAVDMESLRIAAAAAERGLPFLGVRVIIDRAQHSALSVSAALAYPTAALRLRRSLAEALHSWQPDATSA